LDDEAEAFGALLVGSADPFVAVDEFHGGGSPYEDGGPALLVMDERATDLATRSEIVFII
jgi:hypothetical protein